MTTVWEFMLTAVLLGGGAWVVLEGGKQPAATENAQHEINIVDITDIDVNRKNKKFRGHYNKCSRAMELRQAQT